MPELNDDIVREAREARDRLIGLEREADLARVGYQHAIRRLHATGASLREIADALGLSYQRVHQIVDVGAGKGALKASAASPMQCSFCGRPRAEVGKIIAGPGVRVCDGCVGLALEALEHGTASTPGLARLTATDPSQATARCDFCGKRRDQVSGLAVAPDRRVVPVKWGGRVAAAMRREHGEAPRICAECLDLCVEILAEEAAD